jgi:excisionase family DNA binding protein
MATRILTVSELADHLNVHRITIYRLLKSGTLPGFKIGRVWRFDLDEITSWMASGRSTGALMAEAATVDGRPAGDGRISSDGGVSSDGHLPRDGRPKVESAQKRSQTNGPSPSGQSKDTRGGKTPRR